MRHMILLPALLFVLSSCGKESSSPDTSSSKASATKKSDSDEPPSKKEKPAAPAFDPEKTGTIKGNVKLDGDPGRIPIIRMPADPKCAALHSGPVKSDILVLDENQNVRYAFVRVKAGLPQMEHMPPKTPVLLNQKGCMYEPHVFGVMTGQPVLIRNSDPTLHNVHALPLKNREFNIAQQPGQEDTKGFNTEEIVVKIKCDIHPWMRAWAVVMGHPFYSVTGPSGNFEIKGVPAGKYTLEVWHERYKSLTAEVTVKAKESSSIDFLLKNKK